jgi:N-acetylglucosaminyldiphosphoundecaprenol N-acetyl-beta-D-mannosaminyltransferase
MTNQTILTMDVNVTNFDSVILNIMELISFDRGSYVCVSNVHMCMEVFDSIDFSKIVNGADLVIADGKPILWAQKLMGHKEAQQVRGQDIMNLLCEVSTLRALKIGFYGGSSDSLLEKVNVTLSSRYPKIEIVYSYSPPFRPLTDDEDKQVVDDILLSKVDVLFIGIGCPKQEVWMAEHKDKLNCVMLGVGAAFDFIASEKRQAPRWVQHIGMEWFFRLCSEPRRLWKRYLKQNPRFIWYFAQQCLFNRNFRNRS